MMMEPPDAPSKVADAGSIEDMEASLLAAVAGVKESAAGKKRPATSAALTPPAGECMNRPAAACKKRPASASLDLGSTPTGAPQVDMSDIFRKLKASGDVSRNCFCYKAYHTARNRMLVAGALRLKLRSSAEPWPIEQLHCMTH